MFSTSRLYFNGKLHAVIFFSSLPMKKKKGYAKYDDVRTAISLIDRRKENATLCYIDTREREPWQPKWRCAHDGARSFHFILSVYHQPSRVSEKCARISRPLSLRLDITITIPRPVRTTRPVLPTNSISRLPDPTRTTKAINRRRR